MAFKVYRINEYFIRFGRRFLYILAKNWINPTAGRKIYWGSRLFINAEPGHAL